MSQFITLARLKRFLANIANLYLKKTDAESTYAKKKDVPDTSSLAKRMENPWIW